MNNTMNKEFLASLLELQKDLPYIKRNATADAGKFTYDYASLDHIWEEISEILQEHGFYVTNSMDDTGVTTWIFSEHGQLGSTIPFLSVTNPQDRGKEITYYKRYNLVALLNLQIEDEDNDAQSVKAEETEDWAFDTGRGFPRCPVHGDIMRYIKAGTTKSGKEYKAFYACKHADCKETKPA